MKPVQTIVDGVNLNARHFAAMDKATAVKEMTADNILKAHGKDTKWAETAHDRMVEDVRKADAPKVDAPGKATLIEQTGIANEANQTGVADAVADAVDKASSDQPKSRKG